jgi:hypothetical protein
MLPWIFEIEARMDVNMSEANISIPMLMSVHQPRNAARVSIEAIS